MTQPLLAVQDIAKAFGGLQALNRVSFVVNPGTVHAIIGPNGAGKTTLFNILSGLVRADHGQAFLNGVDLLSKPPAERVRCGVARTFQAMRCFARLTVLENVAVAYQARQRASRRQAREAAETLLAQVDLWPRRHAYPGELAYGEQRRLEVARGLAADPRLFLLDEPAAGMTTAEAHQLLEAVHRIRDHGRTVLLIEHNMQVVMQIADWITVLNFGETIAEGPPAEIQRNPRVIEAYLGRSRRALC